MKVVFMMFLAATITSGPANADRPQIIVERPAPDTTQRMTVDPSEMMYQAKVDSLNAVMEEQIQEAIERLERDFENPKTEEEVGRIIGLIVMEKQLALLDIEIDRAINMRDTLLIKGLEYGLEELLRKSPEVRETLRQRIEALEHKFREQESPPAVRKE